MWIAVVDPVMHRCGSAGLDLLEQLQRNSDMAKQCTSAFCNVMHNGRKTSAFQATLIVPDMVIPTDMRQ